jgi:hypothetical protein
MRVETALKNLRVNLVPNNSVSSKTIINRNLILKVRLKLNKLYKNNKIICSRETRIQIRGILNKLYNNLVNKLVLVQVKNKSFTIYKYLRQLYKILWVKLKEVLVR